MTKIKKLCSSQLKNLIRNNKRFDLNIIREYITFRTAQHLEHCFVDFQINSFIRYWKLLGRIFLTFWIICTWSSYLVQIFPATQLTGWLKIFTLKKLRLKKYMKAGWKILTTVLSALTKYILYLVLWQGIVWKIWAIY